MARCSCISDLHFEIIDVYWWKLIVFNFLFMSLFHIKVPRPSNMGLDNDFRLVSSSNKILLKKKHNTN